MRLWACRPARGSSWHPMAALGTRRQGLFSAWFYKGGPVSCVWVARSCLKAAKTLFAFVLVGPYEAATGSQTK